MSNKTFTIEFYTGQVGADGQAGKISQVLRELTQVARCPVKEISGHYYEIRELVQHGGGASFHGVFAKFRKENIPHAGAPGGGERELELDDDEGLLEKNHFLYFRQHELLVYQRNGHGSTTNRMGMYFGEIINETVVFQSVLQLDAMRRLMRAQSAPRSIDISFAKPTNPDEFPANDWNANLLNVLTQAGGARMSLHISAEGRSKNPQKRYLARNIKRTIAQLINNVEVSRARVCVEDEDGIKDPIDLIADRLLSRQEVEMNGHYPVSEEMFRALRRAKNEHSETLHEYFGDDDEPIR